MRFKDLQQDAQTARDEIADLLSQRAQWIEEKASLEQTIGDFSDKIDERDTQLIEISEIRMPCSVKPIRIASSC